MSILRDDNEQAQTLTGGRAHEHPSDFQYVKIALLLAVITAFEVGAHYTDLNNVVIAALYVMMVVKFIVVIAYFMHLKYDSKLLRSVFLGGLALTLAVYIGAIATFGFWTGDFI